MPNAESTTMIKNAIVVTVNPDRQVFFDGAIIFKGSRLIYVGTTQDAVKKWATLDVAEDRPADQNTVIDANGKIIFPGFISTHNHLYQTMLKGCGDDMALADWLSTMMFPASSYLTPENTYYGAMVGLMEGLRSGITTNLDYMYPHRMPGLTDPIIQAYKETGTRCIIGRGGMDTGSEFGVVSGIQQSKEDLERDLIRLFDTYHMQDDGMTRIWSAPAAIWSNSKEMLKMLWEVTSHYKSGFTCHISETMFDREAAMKKHGVTEMEFLTKHGIVGPNVLMVHCVYLTPEEITLSAEHGISISHNTLSNMYLSSGVAPIPAMLEAGLTVSLGVDGAASNNGQDMIELMKSAALLQKVSTLDPTIISAEKVLEMATIEGARALMMEDEIGSLEAGKRADFVLFDPLRSPKAIPVHNPVSTLVYSSTVQNIEAVYVNGRKVVDDGKIQTIPDEKKVLAEAQKSAEQLAQRSSITNRMEQHEWNHRYRW